MRVALVTPGFAANEEDYSIPALYNLVRQLARSHEAIVYSLRYPDAATYRFCGATVHAFGASQLRRARSAPLLVRAARAILRDGRRRRFDVIHGLWAGESGLIAALVARRLGTPAVVSLMGSELAVVDSSRWTRRVAIDQSMRLAQVVTVGSRSFGVQAGERGIDTVVMPLGVDTNHFSADGPATSLEGSPCLLMVASLVPVKNHAAALRAVASLTRRWPSLHLHSVGEGVRPRELLALVEELGIARHVTWHGSVNHARLPEFYRSSDLCLLTSQRESQAMVVLEAAACGRLTVGTRVGIVPEIIPASYTVEPGDVTALSRVLETTLDGQAGAQRVAAEASHLVRSTLSVASRVTALESCYAALRS